jgi:GAF domain-containing protein
MNKKANLTIDDTQERTLERIRTLLNIMQFPAENNKEFLDNALNEAIQLTHSKIGYICFYDDLKQEFNVNTWSKEVMKECSITDPQTVFQLKNTGLWGEAVRQHKTIIVNDFEKPDPFKKGYPKGHSTLNNFLTVPIFNENKIVAVIGVANKQTDYEESDALQLSLLMDAVWKVVDRKLAYTALQESEAKLRSLINASEDVVVLKDKDFKHIWSIWLPKNSFIVQRKKLLVKLILI